MAEEGKVEEVVNPDINAGVPGPDAAGAPKAEDEVKGHVIDLTEQSDEMPSFQALPAGIYKCEIEDASFGLSQAGNEQISWLFRVVEPENKAADQRLLFYHTVTNKESGLARLKRLLVRVAPKVDLKNFDPQVFCESGEVLGFPLRARVNQKFRRDPKTKKTGRQNNIVEVLAPDKTQDFMGEVK